ncbi:MAG: ABC transporter ATP-binding protein [Firmicutes bacterium]|nr:ABC transporter ATP-binding protein [Bacillota bacterium]
MLELHEITKIFNKGSVNEKIALDNISLKVPPGDFITIIGGNGAGKSTLLNCVAGVFPVERGKISLNGEDVTALPDYRRAGDIARIFQDPMMGTAGSMTVEENMALALKRGQKRGLVRGINESRRQFFREKLLLLQLGLENRLGVPVMLLSGGQRQALTLLMTTLVQPRLVLLDEHTASLDPKTALKVLELTRELVEKNKITTLMVTHNMEQALRVGNRTIMMHEGKIILDIKGEQREKMTVAELIDMFRDVSGGQVQSDRMLLT